MDAHEPPSFARDPSPRADWAFSLTSDDVAQQPDLDPDDVAAGRAALRAMAEAFGEVQRQSVLLDAAIAALVAQGATSGHVAGLGLSGPVSERLMGGMAALEWMCRDGVAHFERERRSGHDA